MYRNTMYIPTITSWLHSQWQSYIATKNRICEFDSHNNSVLGTEHRIKIILSIEHQYKNYFVTKTKKTLKGNKFRNNFFFTVTEIVLNDDQVYWSQNSNNKLNLILDIFVIGTDVTQTANSIATVFWFSNNHSNRSLTKV